MVMVKVLIIDNFHRFFKNGLGPSWIVLNYIINFDQDIVLGLSNDKLIWKRFKVITTNCNQQEYI